MLLPLSADKIHDVKMVLSSYESSTLCNSVICH